MAALVAVRDLDVSLGALPVLSGIGFALEPGSITGLFGESGCGKTTLALALLNLLPRRRYRLSGAVQFDGRNLLQLPERELRAIRGARIALLLQDPLLSLHPTLRAGRQISEVARAHSVMRIDLPPALGLTERHLASYPHQLSGGERQRVALAQALVCRPALVIADEPFTALDSARVQELAALFAELRRTLATSFLIVAHDPAVLSALADQVLVMYAGRIVERGAPRDVFSSPLHPYTRGLMECLAPRGTGGRLHSIPGNPPGLRARPSGCAFEPRCGDRVEVCGARVPAAISLPSGRVVECVHYAG